MNQPEPTKTSHISRRDFLHASLHIDVEKTDNLVLITRGPLIPAIARLTLEQAVRKMTSLPAQFLKLKKRGLLAEGFKADIAVFNPDTVRDNTTYATPLMYSTGVESVIVNGKVSVEGGKSNGALNGRMLLLTENK